MVIDVIRAFTTACALFARGAAEVVCLRDAADAALFGQETIIVGETETGMPRSGVIPNSPVAVGQCDVTSRRVALFTLNGTRTLYQAHGGLLLAASAANATATARWIMKHSDGRSIRLVVSDTHGPEDYACARYLAGILRGEPVDAAATAREIVSARQAHWNRWGSRSTPAYWQCFKADVDICAHVDSHPIAMVADVVPGQHPTLRPVRYHNGTEVC